MDSIRFHHIFLFNYLIKNKNQFKINQIFKDKFEEKNKKKFNKKPI